MTDKTYRKWSAKETLTSSKSEVPTAVAVNYSNHKMHAPQVSVKGCEIIAMEMKSIAKRYGVPIHRSKDITEKLSKVEVSTEIPRELYEEISKIFLSIEADSTKK